MSKEAERLQAINAVLSLWRGEQAQFWSYTAALACLEIRLFSRRRPGTVHLVCSPCVSITGPVFWEPCALTVIAEGADELGTQQPGHFDIHKNKIYGMLF